MPAADATKRARALANEISRNLRLWIIYADAGAPGNDTCFSETHTRLWADACSEGIDDLVTAALKAEREAEREVV